MNILLSDIFIDQIKSGKLNEKLSLIYSELEQLKKAGEEGRALEHLKKHNGKKFDNSDFSVFKYRLSDGDRLLYTFGKYVSVNKDFQDCIVLLEFSKHDDQGRVAKSRHYENRKYYAELCDFLKPDDAEDNTYVFDENVFRVYDNICSSGSFKGYKFSEDILKDFSPEDIDKNLILSENQSKIIAEYIETQHPTFISGGAGTGKTLIAVHILSDYCLGASGKRVLYLTQSAALRDKTDKLFQQISEGACQDNVVEFWDLNDFCLSKLPDIKANSLVKPKKFIEIFNNLQVWTQIERDKAPGKIDVLDILTEVRGIIKGGLNNDMDGFVTKEDYLQRKAENTWVEDPEQRDYIYKLSEKYQANLDNNEQVDENDIARKVMDKQISEDEKYDLIVVDEVQDYTEVQLKLIKELSRNDAGLVFVGDMNQVINPTTFTVSRLKKLLYKEKLDLNEIYLHENFRCQQGIIDVANAVSTLRRNKIGARDEMNEQEETAISNSIPVEAQRLAFTDDNKKKILKTASEYPGIAMLVPDDAARTKLEKQLKEENSEASRFIFTLSEIKGMEYKYVIAYNLIGNYTKEWGEIVNDEARKQTRYRYYFNLLYVAATRAQNYLCFIDKEINEQLEQSLKLSNEEVFDKSILHFSELGSSEEDWYNEGLKYMEQQMYDVALERFNKSPSYVKKSDIYRCKMGLAEEKKDYETALKYAFLLQDDASADRYIDIDGDESDAAELWSYWLDQVNDTSGITYAVKQTFRGFDDADIDTAYNIAIRYMHSRIMKRV